MSRQTPLRHIAESADPPVSSVDSSAGPAPSWACKVFGHDMTFSSQGRRMTWKCARGCDVGGDKDYATTEDAAHFAAALDKRDNRDLGRRAPLIGLLPLRLWHRLRNNRPAEGSRHVQ